MTRIIIGADIVPTKSNFDLFKNGDVKNLVGTEILNIFKKADYRIFNLEVPLTEVSDPIVKCGPNLIASTSCVTGYKALGIDLLTLANNHIMDQGVSGLEYTIDTLSKVGIDYVGIGKNIDEARKPYVIELDGMKIGVYACAEHEFSIATDEVPGANPYEPLDSFDDVMALKKECDYVIVLYHGGKEYYRYPSPYLQRIFRKFADVGADLVIAQHTHCVGCKEIYNGSCLIYGQGNFIFDDGNDEYWNSSILVQIDIREKNNVELEYIPIQKFNETVRLAKDANIIKDFEKRSEEILMKDFIKRNYIVFSRKMEKMYFLGFSGKFGKNLLFRILNKLFGYRLIGKMYSANEKIVLENYLACEAHRELFLMALKNRN